MATVILDDGSLYDIADAIRSKLGVDTTYLPRQMAAAIMQIETSSVVEGYYYGGAFYSDSGHTDLITGETGKLYVDLSSGELYRWNGSTYVVLSDSLQLGETSTTAYRGDRGKTAYDHAQAKGDQYSSGLYKITTNSEGHVTNATSVQKSDITALGIPSYDTTYGEPTEEQDGLFTWDEKIKLMNIEANATSDMPHDLDPLMDGVASAGSYNSFARGDHRHPTDTSRMAASLKGAANGVAELDSSGKVPSSQLPSYVDDVLEFSSFSNLPATGETGKIYVVTDTSETYRWSGSTYVAILSPLGYATQAEAEAGVENTHVMTPLRTKQAIDANVSQLQVPLMSPTTRGGAKLGRGLAVTDGALHVAGEADTGDLLSLTGEGWAEQDTTTGKNLAPEFENGGIDWNTGQDANSSTRVRTVGYAEVTENTTYTLSIEDGYKTAIRMYAADGTDMGSEGSVTFKTSYPYTFTTPSGVSKLRFLVGYTDDGNITVSDMGWMQLELGSTATSYEPYSGAAPSPSPSYPQEIRVCRGRNLAFKKIPSTGIDANGKIVTSTTYDMWVAQVRQGITYTMTTNDNSLACAFYATEPESGSTSYDGGRMTQGAFTFVSPMTGYVAFRVRTGFDAAQLELGSVAHPYVPYGYVGIDAYDGNTHITTIPIPLPSRGWVASLPDGTADTLTLDGAGGYVWEMETNEVVVSSLGGFDDTRSNCNGMYGTAIPSNVAGVNSNNARTNILLSHFQAGSTGDANNPNHGYITGSGRSIFLTDGGKDLFTSKDAGNAWLAENPVTVLYPLATPTTESGYVDIPDLAESAVLSCPELENVQVRCIADGAVRELAGAYYDRLAEPVADMQSDLAEVITEAASTRASLATVTSKESYDAQVINGTYEGRSIQAILGTASFDATVAAMHTLAQSKSAGELRLGDYIDVVPTSNTVNQGNAIRCRIAGIGHCYKFGDQECPWAFWMVPDTPINMTGSSYAVNTSYIMWNLTATNNGTEAQPVPYLGSNLHDWELNEFVPAMPTSLQNVMVSHRILFESRYSASSTLTDSNSWAWGDAGKAFSLSETEVYGQCIWGTKGYSVGTDAQLPLFALAPWRRLSGNRSSRWLRTVRSVSMSNVCIAYLYGYANYGSATYEWVRPWPCFLIG